MVYIHEFDELHEIAQNIVTIAKEAGAEQAHVAVFSNENIATRFGESHITQNTQSNSVGFSLQSQIGMQVGNYNGSAAVTPDKLKRMISNAIELVRYSPPDPEFPGFVDYQPSYPDLSRRIVEYEPEELASAILSGIDAAHATNSKISAVAGSINYNASRSVLNNSYGLSAQSDSSTISGIVNIAATEGENESRSSDSIAGLTIEDLAMEQVGTTVAENSVRGLNQGSLDVGGYETILAHSAMMELMFHFGLASSSSMLINHQSPFKDKLGEKLFDERITMIDDTGDASHYSSQAFDFDGIPSPSIGYIEDGIVKDFAYNLRNAKKLGVETNGRSVGNFALFRTPSLKPGTKTQEQMISEIDNGVLVSNLWYSNFVNMPEGTVTGLTRDGLFKIEKGEIVGSLKNMRFTDSLMSMFGNAEPGSDRL
ncbi:MAG: TldD/PmbA family protein, partial [Candidatus Kariarchaeaceae archaeon]